MDRVYVESCPPRGPRVPVTVEQRSGRFSFGSGSHVPVDVPRGIPTVEPIVESTVVMIQVDGKIFWEIRDVV